MQTVLGTKLGTKLGSTVTQERLYGRLDIVDRSKLVLPNNEFLFITSGTILEKDLLYAPPEVDLWVPVENNLKVVIADESQLPPVGDFFAVARHRIRESNRRLLALADYVDYVVKPHKFDYEFICHFDAEENYKMEDSLLDHNCGSTACLLGYAPLALPEFAKYQGELIHSKNVYGFRTISLEGRDIFMISSDESTYLFNNFSGIEGTSVEKKRAAVNRLRQFVADRKSMLENS